MACLKYFKVWWECRPQTVTNIVVPVYRKRKSSKGSREIVPLQLLVKIPSFFVDKLNVVFILLGLLDVLKIILQSNVDQLGNVYRRLFVQISL